MEDRRRMMRVRNPVGKSVGVVLLGCLGWAGSVSATTPVLPGGESGWVIESAEYTGTVQEQIARFEVRYRIRIMRDGAVKIPLDLPGTTVTEIALEKKTGEPQLIPHDGGYHLAASRKGAYTVRVKGAALLQQDSQSEGVRFRIPRATSSTFSLRVPRKDVELRPEDQLYVERQPLSHEQGVVLLARLGAADQIDLQWRTKPSAPVQVEPVLYGDVHTRVILEEQLAHLTTLIVYRIAQGEARELRVRLPAAVNVLNVRGAAVEDWRVTPAPEGGVLVVTLGTPLKDRTYQLAIEGEEPLNADAAEYAVPEFQLEGVKQERGYVAIARSGSVELSARTAEGLHRIDVRELPELMRSAPGSPVMLAFKYHQHPYRGVLGIARHEDHPVLAAIAEQAALSTVLSRQGELLTRAAYLIKSNKQQFIEVALPKGATLWSCLVDGASVKPVAGKAERLLVPLDAGSSGGETAAVELVYFEQRPDLSRAGRLQLEAPLLDIPTTIANWELYAPQEMRFVRLGGNIERGAAPFAFLSESFDPVAMASTGTRLPASVASPQEEWHRGQPAKRSVMRQEQPVENQAGSFMRKNKWGMFEQAVDDVKEFFGGNSEDKLNRDRSDERDADTAQGWVDAFALQAQERGILPLKIQLPRSGRLYCFNRLMTDRDALRIDATFVRVSSLWMRLLSLMGLTLVFLPVGGWVVRLIKKTTPIS